MTLAVVIALEQLHIGSLPLLVAFGHCVCGNRLPLWRSHSVWARVIWRANGSKAKVEVPLAEEEVFVISKSTRTLVFTDTRRRPSRFSVLLLDGRVPGTGIFAPTTHTLIFCTSKTRTEVKALRRATGNIQIPSSWKTEARS